MPYRSRDTYTNNVPPTATEMARRQQQAEQGSEYRLARPAISGQRVDFNWNTDYEQINIPNQESFVEQIRRAQQRVYDRLYRDHNYYGRYYREATEQNRSIRMPLNYDDTFVYEYDMQYGKWKAKPKVKPKFNVGDIVYYVSEVKNSGRVYGVVTNDPKDGSVGYSERKKEHQLEYVWARYRCDEYGRNGANHSGFMPNDRVYLYKAAEQFKEFVIPEKEEIMAFGARKEDVAFTASDGKSYKQTWRLCLRKGRIIAGTAWPTGDPEDWIDFKFRSQKQAKACADELNDKYWAAYKDNGETMDGLSVAEEMVNTIKGYL